MTDQSKNPSPEQIVKLSEEVTRIAEALARNLMNVPPADAQPSGTTAEPNISLEAVSSAIRARRLRSKYFSDDLFSDPAWDMMLELLRAELSGRRITVTALCAAAAVPSTTALRWLNVLVQKGLFTRRDDPLDGRRAFVELAPETSLFLKRYFGEIT